MRQLQILQHLERHGGLGCGLRWWLWDRLRGRLNLRSPRLSAVGILASGCDRELPVRRLRCWRHGAREQDRGLRGQRPAAEAGRRSSDCEERQPSCPDPDVPWCDHGLLQPARGSHGHEARRQGCGRHLPGQGQDLERRGDQGAEPRPHASQHGDHRRPPLGLLGDDGRLHGFPGRGRSRMGEQGRRRRSPGRRVRAPRATRASQERSPRPSAPSAMSSRRTRCSTNSPMPR